MNKLFFSFEIARKKCIHLFTLNSNRLKSCELDKLLKIHESDEGDHVMSKGCTRNNQARVVHSDTSLSQIEMYNVGEWIKD